MKPLLPLILLLAASFAADATSQQYHGVCKAADGTEGDDHNGMGRMSSDARYVVFETKATNLIPGGDANGKYDIYRKDMLTGAVIRCSESTGGVEGDGDSRFPNMSSDGRYVVYYSTSTNLDGAKTNSSWDVFLHDCDLGTTEVVSYNTSGVTVGFDIPAEGWPPSVSDDGDRIAFNASSALDPFDNNSRLDVYFRDRSTGTTTFLDSTLGHTRIGFAQWPSISDDGRYIVFHTNVDFLVSDTGSWLDVYMYDITLATYTLISVTSGGVSGTGNSERAYVDDNGDFVVFESRAQDFEGPADGGNGYDIYIWERSTGLPTLASITSDGDGSTDVWGSSSPGSTKAHCSDDGRYVVFRTDAADMHPLTIDFFGGTYLRDRTAGTTVPVSSAAWWRPTAITGNNPRVSNDGKYVSHTALLLGIPDTEGGSGPTQVIIREMGRDSILLTAGSYFAWWGSTMSYFWANAPASAPYALYYSPKKNGKIINGTTFDIGPKLKFATTGTTAADGRGSWVSPVLPQSASGKRVYLEMRVDDGGVTYDSNMVMLRIG